MKDLIKISMRVVGLVDVVTARLNPRHVRSQFNATLPCQWLDVAYQASSCLIIKYCKVGYIAKWTPILEQVSHGFTKLKLYTVWTICTLCYMYFRYSSRYCRQTFFRFAGNIPFCNSLGKFNGQKNPLIFTSFIFPPITSNVGASLLEEPPPPFISSIKRVNWQVYFWLCSSFGSNYVK